ncbi:MAG: hypothetical protein H6832_10630 [Planctomycetes bacterium]|nr:hypothetical protein [Planctomycetota bacterium]MCB9918845.1 hypothetical protein [Planctomycetota bacterium]
MKTPQLLALTGALLFGVAATRAAVSATIASLHPRGVSVLAILSPQGDKKDDDKKEADASAKKTPPKDDPKVTELLKDLKKIARGKADGDSEGARLLDELANKYEGLNSKQQKAVAKGAGDVFDTAKRKTDEVVLYLSAGEALSRFGENGASELAKAIGKNKFGKKDWSTMRSQLVRMLGRPAVKKYIDTLLDLALKDNDDQARAKAGEALGYYAHYDQNVRKNIFEKLVKSLEESYAMSKSNTDPNDLQREVWVQRYAAIQDPWMKTMGRLTGQSIKDVQEWTKWWNEHKRSNWDKEGFRSSEAPKGDDSK